MCKALSPFVLIMASAESPWKCTLALCSAKIIYERTYFVEEISEIGVDADCIP
jgi:hypothetical protein